jgi:hypothetical protein
MSKDSDRIKQVMTDLYNEGLIVFKPIPEREPGGQSCGTWPTSYRLEYDDIGFSLQVGGRSQLKIRQFCMDVLEIYLQENL